MAVRKAHKRVTKKGKLSHVRHTTLKARRKGHGKGESFAKRSAAAKRAAKARGEA